MMCLLDFIVLLFYGFIINPSLPPTLPQGYYSLLLAEFKDGGELAETFGAVIDQGEPRWAFLQLKKWVFPAAYWELFLRGRWFGSRGVIPPFFDE